MRAQILATVLLAAAPAAGIAQQPSALQVGQAYERTVGPGETHAYSLELAADQFVFGRANQQTVDVVVTVTGPDGEPVGTFDGPAVGPEPFQFTSAAAGTYRIEVAPFEEDEGRYSLRVERVEPKATTPEGTVDQLMAAYAGPDTPGGVVAVVRDGRVAFARGYGMASLEHGIPNSPELRFNVGSVAKQFTAFAVALLAERGELSLDDDIRKHLPEVPDFGDTIRIRHLLQHTSGLREYLNLLAIGGRDIAGGDVIRHDEVLRLVQRQPALQSAPGAAYLYNNTGYALLAEIVERVSGQPFAAWMEENVFRPLGMDETVVVAELGQIIPGRAEGHAPTENGTFRRAEDLSGSWGPGGIYTTADDLARWMGNLGDARVGGPRVIAAMTTPAVLTSGDTLDYGLGLALDEQRGLDRVQHGGNDMGHAAQLSYYPELDAGVIVLSNLAGGHTRGVADRTAEAFFGENMAPAEEAAPAAATAEDGAVELSPAVLDRYAGEYRIPSGPLVSFTHEDGVLHTQIQGQPRFAMQPLSDTTFRVLVPGIDAQVVFHPEAAGPAERATLLQGGQSIIVQRVDRWSPTPEELAEYAGRYYSPELQAVYSIAVEDGGLVAVHPRIGAVELEPGARDAFRSGHLGLREVEFERGADGRVVAFAVSNGRTLDVRFERMD